MTTYQPSWKQKTRRFAILRRRIPLRFVVVSTPRSGTTYVAHVLNNLGLDCGHERTFTPVSHAFTHDVVKPWSRTFYAPRNVVLGDSSWLAVPFIRQLPPGCVVLHQTREPVKSMNSMVHTNHFEWDSQVTPANKYAAFILQHTQELDWPDTLEGRSMLFWTRWHEWILEQCAGRRHLRYKIEEFTPETIRPMLEAIGVSPVSDDRIRAAFDAVPKTSNRRKVAPEERLRTDDLSADARRVAAALGYPIEVDSPT